MISESDFSWLPEELRRDRLAPRGNRLKWVIDPESKPKYSLSIRNAKYAVPLLQNDPALEKLWREIESEGISTLDVFWICENAFVEAALYKTKKLSSKALAELEKDVRLAARKLKNLVTRTPYDEMFSRTEWKDADGEKLEIKFSELLQILETSDMSDMAQDDSYLSVLRSPGAKKAIRSELVFRLNDTMKTANKYFANKAIASLLSTLLGEELISEDVSDLLRKIKKNG